MQQFVWHWVGLEKTCRGLWQDLPVHVWLSLCQQDCITVPHLPNWPWDPCRTQVTGRGEVAQEPAAVGRASGDTSWRAISLRREEEWWRKDETRRRELLEMAAVLVNNPQLLDPVVLLTLPPSPFKGPLLFPIENLLGFLKDLFLALLGLDCCMGFL